MALIRRSYHFPATLTEMSSNIFINLDVKLVIYINISDYFNTYLRASSPPPQPFHCTNIPYFCLERTLFDYPALTPFYVTCLLIIQASYSYNRTIHISFLYAITFFNFLAEEKKAKSDANVRWCILHTLSVNVVLSILVSKTVALNNLVGIKSSWSWTLCLFL